MKSPAPLAALMGGVCLATALVPTQGADSWPQFRGLNASGISAIARPPATFGPDDHQLWKVAIPWSPSSPVVWNDRIFLTTLHDGLLETRAHDANTGRLLWNRGLKVPELETFHRSDGSPAASTPATDGAHVVSYFGSFGLICHDPNGKELWRHPLPLALSGGNYGSGTSPIISGNRVFLSRDLDVNSTVLAVDLNTGRTLWETARPDTIGGFSTPIVWNSGGREDLVVAGSLNLKGYDPASGTERWQVQGVSVVVCPTPVSGDGLLYFGAWSPGKADSSFPTDWTAFLGRFDQNKDDHVNAADFEPARWDFIRGIDVDRDGEITEKDLERIRARAKRAENVLVAVRPGGQGDITGTHVAWKFAKGLPYVPSPLFYEGRIYMVKTGGLMSSLDAATGKPFYQEERLGTTGDYYASPVAAGGRIYVASLPGILSAVQAGGSSLQVLWQVNFGERILATPALVGDRVYVRTQEHLYAFGGNARP